ncbi:hypothetical protein BAE44_0017268, partial [Dichanthelium oligosanthes]
LPYVPPYLGPPFDFPSPANNSRFRQGASFAVGAATALDVEFFRERDIPDAKSTLPFNVILGVQLQWFESLKPSLCSTTKGTFDQNEVGRHHNTLLQASPEKLLRAKYPHTTIIYADFFNLVMEMVESPHKFGKLEQDRAGNMGAFSTRAAAVSLPLLLLLLSPSPSSSPVAAAAPSLRARRYDSIFTFGDSYTDTGNNPVVFGWYAVPNPVTRPPYGSDFFGRPTGCNCDGRLAIDFIGVCVITLSYLLLRLLVLLVGFDLARCEARAFFVCLVTV